MFKRMRHKGALFIEYALILAFVIGSGLTFVTSNGFSDSVGDIFEKTGDLTEKAANGSKSISYALKVIQGVIGGSDGHYTNVNYQKVLGLAYDENNYPIPFALEANSTYELAINLSKAVGDIIRINSSSTSYISLTPQLYIDKNGSLVSVLDAARTPFDKSADYINNYLDTEGYSYNNSNYSKYKEGNPDGIKISASKEGSILTYTIKTGNDTGYFSANIVYDKYNYKNETTNNKISSEIENFVNNGITFTKK